MKMRKSDNKGFTLVELIVVLVILAILAAILVPALLGYIDEAKKKQDLLDARYLLMATQSEMSKLYAEDTFAAGKESVFLSDKSKNIEIKENEKNVYLKNSEFAKNIYKIAGLSDSEKPYYYIFGMGDYRSYVYGKFTHNSYTHDETKNYHKAYTVYYAIYQKTQNSEILYYDGSEWGEVPPQIAQGLIDENSNMKPGVQSYDRNSLYVGNEKIHLQYYAVAYSRNDWWKVYQDNYKKKIGK